MVQHICLHLIKISHSMFCETDVFLFVYRKNVLKEEETID